MECDPEARRDTPLALKLKARIRAGGPISVTEYMRACLYDAEHGYYCSQTAIGAQGDFITAPEVSQVFGELIGLWCAVVWQQMGQPSPFNLVEYGPGRGTLMADALRALQRVPDCLRAVHVRLIEVSPVLRQMQRERLAGATAPVTWHRTLREEVEPWPSIIVANEVLDVFPVEQWLRAGDKVWIRGVGLGAGDRLEFRALLRPGDGLPPVDAEVAEVRELDHSVSYDMASLPRAAALFVDYGHMQSMPGDTLQAVRDHRFEHPLCSPGEADVTAQVDFEWFGFLCREAGLEVDGPVTQSHFLGQLGIIERASRLMAANPGKAGEIEAGVARLISPAGMGGRFKAIGVRSPGVPVLPGFEKGQ